MKERVILNARERYRKAITEQTCISDRRRYEKNTLLLGYASGKSGSFNIAEVNKKSIEDLNNNN